jgi:hypothetical protein
MARRAGRSSRPRWWRPEAATRSATSTGPTHAVAGCRERPQEADADRRADRVLSGAQGYQPPPREFLSSAAWLGCAHSLSLDGARGVAVHRRHCAAPNHSSLTGSRFLDGTGSPLPRATLMNWYIILLCCPRSADPGGRLAATALASAPVLAADQLRRVWLRTVQHPGERPRAGSPGIPPPDRASDRVDRDRRPYGRGAEA